MDLDAYVEDLFLQIRSGLVALSNCQLQILLYKLLYILNKISIILIALLGLHIRTIEKSIKDVISSDLILAVHVVH